MLAASNAILAMTQRAGRFRELLGDLPRPERSLGDLLKARAVYSPLRTTPTSFRALSPIKPPP